MVGRFGRGRLAALIAVVGALGVMAAFASAAAAYSPIYLDPEASFKGPAIASTADGGVMLTITFDEHMLFCRIDPGGSTCAAAGGPTAPFEYEEDLGNWPFVAGNQIGLLDTRRADGGLEKKLFYRYDEAGHLTAEYEVASTTAGGTLAFTEAAEAPAGALTPMAFIGTVAGGSSSEGAVLAASEAFPATGTGSKFVVSRNAANTANVSDSDAAISVQGALLSSAYIGLAEGPGVYWRHLIGTGAPSFIQSNTHWSTPKLVGQSVSSSPIRMATGPGGLYLAYQRPGDGAVVLQKYEGGETFGAPLAITPGEISDFAIAEDPAGLIHVVYSDGGSEPFLHYSYAKDASNAVFTRPQVFPTAAYRDLRLVANSDGGGWVSWLDDETDSTFVLQLAPGEPAEPTSGGGGAPSAPSGGGGTGGPPSGGGTKKAPTPAAPTATVSGSLGHGLVGQLSVPKQCVAGGTAFKATLRVKQKGSKAHKVSYTVKGVAFSLGGKPIATDTAKPFEASFSTKGAGADKPLTVTAKVSVNLHLAHRISKVTKTLTAKVRTCG
jgi:hypothetical protein